MLLRAFPPPGGHAAAAARSSLRFLSAETSAQRVATRRFLKDAASNCLRRDYFNLPLLRGGVGGDYQETFKVLFY